MKKPFPEKPFILRTPRAYLSAVQHIARSHRLVILCHGYTGTKTESGRLFVQTARALQKTGINVLRFDFMGSGDSSGEFNGISPNSQIRDTLNVLAWGRRRFKKVGLLGLSFGGGTVICAAQQARHRPDAMVTWSSVPSFRWWLPVPPSDQTPEPGNPLIPGRRFYSDRPKVDVPEAYRLLDIPRLQIQGDRDIPEFTERFKAFCPQNDPQVRHLILPGADHVFTRWEHRRHVIAETVDWFRKYLA